MKYNIKQYLDLVANIITSDIPDDDGKVYVSKFDGSYITRVGMEEDAKHLAARGITEQLRHGTGFSPEEEKWYGWSHRAIYGFKIGSTCKQGDCHFVPGTREEALTQFKSFWTDDEFYKVDSIVVDTFIDPEGIEQMRMSYVYNDIVPNESLRGTAREHVWPMPTNWGRGEWTAQTMEDAEKMAKDFNEGVS